MTHVSSLYLHVPFCKHLCNYCDFYKKQYDPASNQLEDFHQFLNQSWDTHENLLKDHGMKWSSLESIYLGGGTPSLWGEAGAKFMQSWLQDKLSLAHNCEFTMEVDPGTWKPDMINSWSDIGLNRISIGTQSLDPVFLKIMDRVHSLDETHELLSYCQKKQLNFSLDFLLGIPFSKEKNRDIKKELDQLLQYGPKHISLYILNARTKYPLIDALPDDEYIREEYLMVSEYLQSKGFNHYEVSNFALPGFESRHNMKYWRGESVAALGPTGTGLLSLSKNSGVRYKWKVSKADYETENLGPEEMKLEHIYLSLRTSQGWKPNDLTPQLERIFQKWVERELGFFEKGTMSLKPYGFVILDSLMDELFKEKLA
jgi:oxygen-independent coproporphyrinogen III oxidase